MARTTHFASFFLFISCTASIALASAASYSSSSAFCKKSSLRDSIHALENQCPLHDVYLDSTFYSSSVGVLEVNGTTLDRSLQSLQSQENFNAAVLIYARWCPFSRALRPLFDSLSAAFPSIHHFAVEESVLQPSVFSSYGVHSFPALILQNKTTKFRYHGSRTFKAIVEFYKVSTGLQPVELSDMKAKNPMEGNLLEKFQESEALDYHHDVYLALSVVFLLSRVLFYFQLKLLPMLKHCWVQKATTARVHRNILQRVVFRRFEQEKTGSGSSKCVRGKSPSRKDLTQETGKVLLSVPGWSSSPLAAVALAEGSSSRTGGKEDTRDGHAFGHHFWG